MPYYPIRPGRWPVAAPSAGPAPAPLAASAADAAPAADPNPAPAPTSLSAPAHHEAADLMASAAAPAPATLSAPAASQTLKSGGRPGSRKSARLRSLQKVTALPKPHPNCFALWQAREERGRAQYIGLMRYLNGYG